MSADAVELRVLGCLIEKHRLGETGDGALAAAPQDSLEERVRLLEEQVAELREQLDRAL